MGVCVCEYVHVNKTYIELKVFLFIITFGKHTGIVGDDWFSRKRKKKEWATTTKQKNREKCPRRTFGGLLVVNGWVLYGTQSYRRRRMDASESSQREIIYFGHTVVSKDEGGHVV